MSTKFPNDFLWGAATSAYQIEGAHNADGRGESIWDRFSSIKGNIKNNDNGNVACDHYNRYRQDINIMEELNLQAYRFSLSWSRIFPDGKGKVNQKGLDYYSSLVDGLLAKNIKPFITLFHWDLPLALQEKKGWENLDTTEYFRDYACFMVEKFGDRVKNWITLNEPAVFVDCGYFFGCHAPGIKDMKKGLLVAHNLLLGHGKAIKDMRSIKNDLSLAITLSSLMYDPATNSSEDIEAAKRYEISHVKWYLDPLFKGKYPDAPFYDKYLDSEIQKDDMNIISQDLDWLGINNYFRALIKHDDNGFLSAKNVLAKDAKITTMNWEINPQGMYRILKYVNDNYNPKAIYITENGASFNDKPDKHGNIDDDYRIEFLNDYILNVKRAIDDNINVKGYFCWSLLDNFEWAEGFEKRFGLVYVDFNSLKRTIKKSAYWYKDIISSNGQNLHG